MKFRILTQYSSTCSKNYYRYLHLRSPQSKRAPFMNTFRKGQLPREVEPHHDHARHPEEQNVESGLQ